MDNKDQQQELLEGPILQSLVKLSLPIVMANILQTAYQLIDTFWVGRLGEVAVAAVSLSFPIIFLVISLGGGMGIAGTILVSQFKGKGAPAEVEFVTGQTVLVMFLSALVLMVPGYLLADDIIALMGAEGPVMADATAYLRVSVLGILFLFMYFVFQSLMRGVGDVKTPLYIVLGTVLLNLVLDPLFIFGYGPIPAQGVEGAAYATLVTQGLAAVIGIWMMLSGRYQIHLRLRYLVPSWNTIQRMVLLGMPASIEQSSRALGIAFLTSLVATFGTTVIASYGIGTRILSFVIIPALGLSMSTSTLVGQNIGAGNITRAGRISNLSALIGFMVLTVVGGIAFLAAEPLAAFFLPGEPESIMMSAQFIRIMSLTFGFIGIQMAINGAFRGSGNTLVSMVLAIIGIWVLRFPVAYLLSLKTSLAYSGLFWAFPISNVGAAVVSFLWFRTGKWKEKQLTQDFALEEKIAEEIITEEGYR